MKLVYGGVPYNSLKVKHYEVSTNDCDMIASDLQAGKTAVARGQKIIGTGKSFEFAYYGQFETNDTFPIPSIINVVEVASLLYPIQLAIPMIDMKNRDFSIEQVVGNVIVNNVSYPIKVKYTNNQISITCEQTFPLQVFFGKDNYV